MLPLATNSYPQDENPLHDLVYSPLTFLPTLTQRFLVSCGVSRAKNSQPDVFILEIKP
jgi:hypothetical protein